MYVNFKVTMNKWEHIGKKNHFKIQKIITS